MRVAPLLASKATHVIPTILPKYRFNRSLHLLPLDSPATYSIAQLKSWLADIVKLLPTPDRPGWGLDA